MKDSPVIGIVGSEGAYGRWLRRFFGQRMGLRVLGSDPAARDGLDPEALLARCDVLVFSAPIRLTPELIGQYAALAGGRESGQLWLDVTSIKAAPVQAMLASQAEVVGLHPMTAPPKSPTLKGRVMVVCEARLQHWRGWLQRLLDALEADCVHAAPDHHDQVMALVQAMVHATHLAQAGVLREYAPVLGDLAALMPYRSASFEMDVAALSRILSLNPSIYEDIQFNNPHAGPVLEALVRQLSTLQGQVGQGDAAARTSFREEFFDRNRQALGEAALAAGNYGYERIGYLLADLNDSHTLSIHLPQDRPGSLRELLHVFERHGVSIASLHSSRTPAGELHFRLGFNTDTDPPALRTAAAEVDASGIGHILPQ
ncbi:prephenate dehydrogenase [Pseudoxanthomonas kalamensis DSM 18571]|uniref:prephenate dehydrogenase n=1 Tax=Pseudoxanthomonas kalamensis TaxID=289483 RepID=UPI0013910D7E|nr:prephenate dehydrogenase [Pseudoxanthomonas kalamensis]KAF1709867.1 prephenate dehydrogenase [Pseudoxanthomonas kalamensis DSM 18571]